MDLRQRRDPRRAAPSTTARSRRSAAARACSPPASAASKGRFQRGDTVAILGPAGEEIGRGLVAYDAADAERIAGRNSARSQTILGYAGRAEMIHRDDMVMRGE